MVQQIDITKLKNYPFYKRVKMSLVNMFLKPVLQKLLVQNCRLYISESNWCTHSKNYAAGSYVKLMHKTTSKQNHTRKHIVLFKNLQVKKNVDDYEQHNQHNIEKLLKSCKRHAKHTTLTTATQPHTCIDNNPST